MKVGVLTFHQSVNNGAVIQAYSLSKRIQQEYPDAKVEIIDYQMKKVSKSYSYSLKSYLKTSSPIVFLKKCRVLINDPMYLRRMRKRTEVFKKCLYKLPLSEKTIIDDGTDEVFEYINSNYDVLVVGSDAVWNYISRGFPNAYLPDDRVKVKKLSYAASCYGMNFLKCPENDREKLKNILEGFSFIGVRDEATEKLVEWSGCSKESYHTCDPTAFVDIDDLPIDEEKLKEKLKKRGFDFNKASIGIMGTNRMFQMVKSFYGDKYQIVSLYNYIKGADVNLYDLEPYEWAYVFRLFKLTFTTYFHGTLLSLRNGTPLICIALDTDFSKAHVPKTLDVLKRVGFEDWYFSTDYVSKNYPEIKEKADELLEGEYKEKIIRAIDKESESFENFNLALKNIL